jgi:hypothetical protein
MTRTDPTPKRATGASVPEAPVRLDRRPVQRADGPHSMTILAVSFGVTVVVTRLYLSLTGYPQIGHGEFHLAHALWGGLLLMVAATLQLLWSNGWVMSAAAVCAGAGSGLFVDEVGKFITARNDYFTPLQRRSSIWCSSPCLPWPCSPGGRGSTTRAASRTRWWWGSRTSSTGRFDLRRRRSC